MDQEEVERLKKFFFEAALVTYASGIKAEKQPGGYRSYSYRKGTLKYIDRYNIGGQSSFGQTVISDRNDAVWVMQYHGWCKNDSREVLSFLKQALITAYQEKQFNGGRGPSLFHSEGAEMTYYNRSKSQSGTHFTRFTGYEHIVNFNHQEIVFWHHYQGYLLEP